MFNEFTRLIAQYLNKYNISGHTEYDLRSRQYVVHVTLSNGVFTKWYIPARWVEDPCSSVVSFYLGSIVNAYY